ncbi:hypothetical protein M409DRAFT_24718 [Zasmidium cellare ATCC 36951]|uniref:Uncharacterized protein n=1 Tax=Zasmidium cellare ATCC 36951 TaxID=1080233 RepID=A0A6A6CDL9_ZASCE|nr:uncharacterized protein M409DRAFT_24718 [Zasmidium cellare ATCC 36951]KAF2164813.1 hypothetical protein M409DRAFT_24718 [Zasmidium cellare ATCC 36951]
MSSRAQPPSFLTTFCSEPAQDVDMEKLIRHIHDLPVDIFDIIQDFFFTMPPRTMEINGHYRPPAELQISRETRKKFAWVYYTFTTFFASCWDDQKVYDWLKSLPRPHLYHVDRIEMYVAIHSKEALMRLTARPRLCLLRSKLVTDRWVKMDDVLYLRYSDGSIDDYETCAAWAMLGPSRLPW